MTAICTLGQTDGRIDSISELLNLRKDAANLKIVKLNVSKLSTEDGSH